MHYYSNEAFIMLKEYKIVRQIKGEASRRWFSDEYFDLIAWFHEQGEIVGFQLCYDIERFPRALTWKQEGGYTHHRIDNGENRPGKMKASPILVADGIFDPLPVAERFKNESLLLEPSLAEFVYQKLLSYPYGRGQA